MKYFIVFSMMINTAMSQSLKVYDYAFQKEEKINVYSNVDKKPIFITNGPDPDLSPDGKKLAYTSHDTKGNRTVVVIDLSSKKKTTLNLNSQNCYGPVWSPDGNYIAYNIYENGQWKIGMIDKSNTTALIITKNIDNAYAPYWCNDSKKMVVQDMTNVYIVNLNGDIEKKYNIEAISKEHSISSASAFALDKSEQYIIFNATVDESNFDEYPDAIFAYQIQSGKLKRITPKGVYCGNFKLSGNKILFTGYKNKIGKTSVFEIALDGSGLKEIFKETGDFSTRIK